MKWLVAIFMGCLLLVACTKENDNRAALLGTWTLVEVYTTLPGDTGWRKPGNFYVEKLKFTADKKMQCTPGYYVSPETYELLSDSTVRIWRDSSFFEASYAVSGNELRLGFTRGMVIGSGGPLVLTSTKECAMKLIRD